jgi:hypothetical protein
MHPNSSETLYNDPRATQVQRSTLGGNFGADCKTESRCADLVEGNTA